jgi:predicted HTH domain antitoxin
MQIILNIPDHIKLDASEHDIKMHMACKLYETGLLDTGYAAKSIGITRREFIENMGKYGASIFNLSDEELIEDIRVARQA